MRKIDNENIMLALYVCILIIIIAFIIYCLYKLFKQSITNFKETFYNKRNRKIEIYKSDEIYDPDENEENEEYDPDSNPNEFDPD